MDRPPDGGVNVFLSWGMLEWALTGLVTAGGMVAAWVWHLAQRVARAEQRLNHKREELDSLRNGMIAMNKKLDVNMVRMEERMDKAADKMEQLQLELPSRAFIESQFMMVTARIDRLMEGKRP